jgi:hypothetical protein
VNLASSILSLVSPPEIIEVSILRYF